MSIKRLRFEDIIKEAEDDTVADDAATRFDLDFTLMTLELAEFLPDLFATLGGEELPDDAVPVAEASAA
jgi:recombination associated protein RdgC